MFSYGLRLWHLMTFTFSRWLQFCLLIYTKIFCYESAAAGAGAAAAATATTMTLHILTAIFPGGPGLADTSLHSGF